MDLYTSKLAQGIPIVNHLTIKDHIGKEVMVFGKKSSYKDGTLFICPEKTGEHTIIVRNFGGDIKEFTETSHVCIIGSVEPDRSISYLDDITEGMDNFDFLDNLNKLLELYQNKKEIQSLIVPEKLAV